MSIEESAKEKKLAVIKQRIGRKPFSGEIIFTYRIERQNKKLEFKMRKLK